MEAIRQVMTYSNSNAFALTVANLSKVSKPRSFFTKSTKPERDPFAPEAMILRVATSGVQGSLQPYVTWLLIPSGDPRGAARR